MLTIQFLYFDGCPSYIPALENLKMVINELDIDVYIDIVKIKSVQDAERHNFQGSPSIMINGIDIENKSDDFNLKCRLYEIDGKLTGVPSKEFIKNKIINSTKS